MKVYYMKSTVVKDLSRSFDESVKMMEENPELYVPEVMEVYSSLDSVDIPEHLVETFKEKFKDENVLTEEDIVTFLEENK